MKIGMMSAWNLDAGPSIHAELIGREWVKMGHKLHVFSFLRSDYHGTVFVREDEDYVHRCFGTRGDLDPRPILRSDFNYFIVQDLCMLPKDDLGKIYHHIKRKAKTINIIHDAELSSNPSFYQFDWDAIVCFDDRYRMFLREVYPENQIYTIPYPCHPVVKGDKIVARRMLGLPEDKKILLVFGQRVRGDLEMIRSISSLGRKYSILLLIVSIHAEGLVEAENIQVGVRREAPRIDELYNYLHAADALILNRRVEKGAVISSTAHQCLGAGCPIVALDSPFFEYFKDEVLKYRTSGEFEDNLIEVFEGGEKVRRSLRAAEKYVKENSSEKIAERYLELFRRL
ncbi:MAG: hypothetical protein ACUVTM_05755 [Candidatus Bathyarchaeia archaeon]